jgi:spermidine synthase
VKKWTQLDSVKTPDGRSLTLAEHDGTYSISVAGAELMSTRKHASEDRLAELACQGLKEKKGARVLIGGLGLGFTLKAALEALGRDAVVVQAEILPAVIEWNRNPAYGLAHQALQDRRVDLVQQDVAKVIRASTGGFDAIMLDVDNGPAALTVDGNRGLYVLSGLQAVRAALRPGGRVVYWAAAPDLPFEKLMGKAGFQVEVQRCRAHTDSGSWHTLYVGQATPAAASKKRPAPPAKSRPFRKQ